MTLNNHKKTLASNINWLIINQQSISVIDTDCHRSSSSSIVQALPNTPQSLLLCPSQFQNHPCPPSWAFDFRKIWVKIWQFRWSNALWASASKLTHEIFQRLSNAHNKTVQWTLEQWPVNGTHVHNERIMKSFCLRCWSVFWHES